MAPLTSLLLFVLVFHPDQRSRQEKKIEKRDALVKLLEDLDVTKVVEDLGSALFLCEEFRPQKVCEIVVGVFPFPLLDRVPDVFRVEEDARFPLEPGVAHVSARREGSRGRETEVKREKREARGRMTHILAV